MSVAVKHRFFEPFVSHFQSERPIRWAEEFDRNAPLDVEIGFGLGEVLVRNAQEFPERNFVGIEDNWERFYKTLKTINRLNQSLPEGRKLDNIKLLKIDARDAFERLFEEATISRIYSLFPCPWPKKSHIKHRLFSESFLKLLNSRLQDNGELKVVTDYYPYQEWLIEQINQTGFQSRTNTIQPQFNTKFERKWKEGGQETFYEVLLHKIRHVPVPRREDTVLKAYKINDFDYDQFQWTDQKGETTVILKDQMYDPQKKRALFSLMVAEEHLHQNFKVVVFQKKDFWRICKAEGQQFFPTPGISRAVECVYQAAKATSKQNS